MISAALDFSGAGITAGLKCIFPDLKQKQLCTARIQREAFFAYSNPSLNPSVASVLSSVKAPAISSTPPVGGCALLMCNCNALNTCKILSHKLAAWQICHQTLKGK